MEQAGFPCPSSEGKNKIFKAYGLSLKLEVYFSATAVQNSIEEMTAVCKWQMFLVSQVCIRKEDVTDLDSLLSCMEAKFSDDCHDDICDEMSDAGAPCPWTEDRHFQLLTVSENGNCADELIFATQICLRTNNSDKDSYLSCISRHNSDYCHCAICSQMADAGYPCPDSKGKFSSYIAAIFLINLSIIIIANVKKGSFKTDADI